MASHPVTRELLDFVNFGKLLFRKGEPGISKHTGTIQILCVLMPLDLIKGVLKEEGLKMCLEFLLRI